MRELAVSIFFISPTKRTLSTAGGSTKRKKGGLEVKRATKVDFRQKKRDCCWSGQVLSRSRKGGRRERREGRKGERAISGV